MPAAASGSRAVGAATLALPRRAPRENSWAVRVVEGPGPFLVLETKMDRLRLRIDIKPPYDKGGQNSYVISCWLVQLVHPAHHCVHSVRLLRGSAGYFIAVLCSFAA